MAQFLTVVRKESTPLGAIRLTDVEALAAIVNWSGNPNNKDLGVTIRPTFIAGDFQSMIISANAADAKTVERGQWVLWDRSQFLVYDHEDAIREFEVVK